MVGNKLLRDLRKLADVVIPNGVKRIGSCWFSATGIKSVVIPASVREVGEAAFIKCRALKQITFAEGSALKTIRNRCF